MTSNVIPIDERRRAPRIPLDAPLTLVAPRGRRSPGRTVNASERGLLVDCRDLPQLAPEEDVSVRLGVGDGEFEIPASVVRIEEARGWVALRFTGPAKRVERGPVRRVRRSRARPKEPRARAEVRAELHALASLTYEHALVDAGADAVRVAALLGRPAHRRARDRGRGPAGRQPGAAARDGPGGARRRRGDRGRLSVDWKLELVLVPVSDVDRAKDFYVERCGFRLDVDHQAGEQLPRRADDAARLGLLDQRRDRHHEQAAGLGRGPAPDRDRHRGRPGRAAPRGVEASEIFHFGPGGREPGPDPARGDYASFLGFSDPDGNSWVVQEVRTPARRG